LALIPETGANATNSHSPRKNTLGSSATSMPSPPTKPATIALFLLLDSDALEDLMEVVLGVPVVLVPVVLVPVLPVVLVPVMPVVLMPLVLVVLPKPGGWCRCCWCR
jgi:hypothetical protein